MVKQIEKTMKLSEKLHEKLRYLAEQEKRPMTDEINFLIDKRYEELGILLRAQEATV
jgi:hypothetical protein